MTMRRALSPWTAPLLILLLLAAACRSADTNDGAARVVQSDDEEIVVDSAESDVDPATEPAPETEPVELTASFRGVTAESIKVGVTALDWDALADLGLHFGRSNSGDLWEAALERINDNGVVYGRTLEIVVEEVLPIGSVDFDEACARLTEDEEVFLVVGQALEDQVLCLIELNETAAVTVAGMADPILDRAVAPYTTLWASFETQATNLVALVEESGALEGATIGVTGSADIGLAEYEAIVAAFRAAGYDVVEALVDADGSDIQNTEQDLAVVFERFRDAGVDFTVSTTGVPLEIAGAQNAGYTTDQWLLTVVVTESGLSDAGVDTDYLDGALAIVNTDVATTNQPSMGSDPAVAACIDELVAATGHALSYELGTEVNDIATGLHACAIADIVEQALTNAGPVLTNDSFQSGLEEMGDIDLAGYLDASLEAGDLGAAKGLRFARFDAGAWELID
ncbi:MAG: ABC transporter substrate-binding protein [Acidimicrobiales bacterium]|jgi:hypothetical protein|nr:ABC transporter substrate-binding protein [Acidimicrobiales bacterium]